MMAERLTSLRRWAVAALLAASAFRPVQGFDAVRGSVPARVELGGGVTEAVELLIRQMDYFIKDDLLGFQEKHDARH